MFFKWGQHATEPPVPRVTVNAICHSCIGFEHGSAFSQGSSWQSDAWNHPHSQWRGPGDPFSSAPCMKKNTRTKVYQQERQIQTNKVSLRIQLNTVTATSRIWRKVLAGQKGFFKAHEKGRWPSLILSLSLNGSWPRNSSYHYCRLGWGSLCSLRQIFDRLMISSLQRARINEIKPEGVDGCPMAKMIRVCCLGMRHT